MKARRVERRVGDLDDAEQDSALQVLNEMLIRFPKYPGVIL
jgi:hypothetical protein